MGLIPSVIVLLLTIGCVALMIGGWRSRRLFRTIGGVVGILLAAYVFAPYVAEHIGSAVGTVFTWLIPLLAAAALIAAVFIIVRIIRNR